MDYTEKLVRHLNGYNGLIVNTILDRVELENGEHTLREVVMHPGGVAIIPIDDDGFVYCVRQYRYPISEHLLEIPAGKLEKEEEPLHCAVRELSEETGISAEKYTFLGEIYPSPGFCQEVLYIYMAQKLNFGKPHPDHNEFLDIEKKHIDELLNMVMSNEISDAKTVIAILKANNILSK